MALGVSINAKGFEAMAKELKLLEKQMKRAGKRSVNKMATVARRESIKQTQKQLNLTRFQIEEKVSKVKKARTTIRLGAISAVIFYREIPFALIQFPHSPTFESGKRSKRGISIKIKKGKPRTRLKKAFIARGKFSGAKQIFQREGKARLPINKLVTTSVADMMDSRVILIPVETLIAIKFPLIMRKELEKEVGR